MKKINSSFSSTLLLICMLLFPATLSAQVALSTIECAVKRQDSLFWDGYNSFDFEVLAGLIAEDVEFYHGEEGLTKGKPALFAKLKSIHEPGFKLRRKVLYNTLKVHMLRSADTVYGVLVSGLHQFYLTPEGRPQRLNSQATFSELWLLNNADWKLARAFNYDHEVFPYIVNQRKVHISSKMQKKLAGTYQSKEVGKIIVTISEGIIRVQQGNKIFHLYPKDQTTFFTEERELTFSFSQIPGGIKKLVMRKYGDIVAEGEEMSSK